MELVKIDQDNMDYYRQFDCVYCDKLSEFQSRIYPSDDSEHVNWYYIKVDNNIIGSVWLEKKENESFATLGIFIADAEYRGQGIGKQAIHEIINIDTKAMEINEIRLHVRETNVRAIKCYSDLGFTEFQRYKKENGITVISMKFQVS